MTRALQTWRIDLMRAHPRLFEVMSDEPHLSFGYPNCEEGWREILETLCTRIETALGEDESFQFVRIKQKFGLIRADYDYEGPEETEAKVGSRRRSCGRALRLHLRDMRRRGPALQQPRLARDSLRRARSGRSGAAPIRS
jgi:hypothetical protein